MTTNTAENATAGVPVVRGLVWTMEMIPPSGEWLARSVVGLYSIPLGMGAYQLYLRDGESMGQFSEVEDAWAFAQADYEQRITSALNPDFLSALDTARAEIERLGKLMAPEATVAAIKGHQLCMEAFREQERRALTAESALTAAQARIADLEGALREIAAPIEGVAVGDPWAFYADMQEHARATISHAVKEPK